MLTQQKTHVNITKYQEYIDVNITNRLFPLF